MDLLVKKKLGTLVQMQPKDTFSVQGVHRRQERDHALATKYLREKKNGKSMVIDQKDG